MVGEFRKHQLCGVVIIAALSPLLCGCPAPGIIVQKVEHPVRPVPTPTILSTLQQTEGVIKMRVLPEEKYVYSDVRFEDSKVPSGWNFAVIEEEGSWGQPIRLEVDAVHWKPDGYVLPDGEQRRVEQIVTNVLDRIMRADAEAKRLQPAVP